MQVIKLNLDSECVKLVQEEGDNLPSKLAVENHFRFKVQRRICGIMLRFTDICRTPKTTATVRMKRFFVRKISKMSTILVLPINYSAKRTGV